MKKIFLLSALILSYIGVCAQEVGDIIDLPGGLRGRWLGDVRDYGGTNFKLQVNPEDLGQIKGVIKSTSGKNLKDVKILITSFFSSRTAKSKKDGSFVVGSEKGKYVIEAIAPGYKKYVGEVAIVAQDVVNYDITLESDVEGVDKMNGKGNMIATMQSGYSMKVASSHPAYKGKSLWYLLCNSPMIVVESDKITVDNNVVQFFFNGLESRAPLASLKAFCESIEIKNVVEISVAKVPWSNGGQPPHLIYITYKE